MEIPAGREERIKEDGKRTEQGLLHNRVLERLGNKVILIRSSEADITVTGEALMRSVLAPVSSYAPTLTVRKHVSLGMEQL